MKYLVSAAEMQRYDNNTIEKIGIPACVLMERAALAAVRLVEEHCRQVDCTAANQTQRPYHESNGRSRVLVMVGTGNNGGDGLAAARLLAEKDYSVEVWCVGDANKASSQWKQQMKILEHYPVEILTAIPKAGTMGLSYDVLIDALFGVGLSRNVAGEYAEAIAAFNRTEGWKLSLDLPSGIDSDTGNVLGCAVKADATVTFGFCKTGLVLYPGCEYAGQVAIADIGISDRSLFGEVPKLFAYDEPAENLLPKRNPGGNKGTFGKVLCIAGSKKMAGAAVLATKATYRAGAGMVKVITPEENREILLTAVPEVLFGTREELLGTGEELLGTREELFRSREASDMLAWADVIAIGPGIGKEESALQCLKTVIIESNKPLLIDADGLNLLSEHSELQNILAKQGAQGRKIILTPHVGELARLADKTITQCKENLIHVGCELAERLHATVTAKDARTFICREGHPVCVNLSGNSGMATAGSGDVLAGITAAFLAQGMDAFEAASVAAYVHGKAGDAASHRLGEHAVIASDLIGGDNEY